MSEPNVMHPVYTYIPFKITDIICESYPLFSQTCVSLAFYPNDVIQISV